MIKFIPAPADFGSSAYWIDDAPYMRCEVLRLREGTFKRSGVFWPWLDAIGQVKIDREVIHAAEKIGTPYATLDVSAQPSAWPQTSYRTR